MKIRKPYGWQRGYRVTKCEVCGEQVKTPKRTVQVKTCSKKCEGELKSIVMKEYWQIKRDLVNQNTTDVPIPKDKTCLTPFGRVLMRKMGFNPYTGVYLKK